VGNQSLSKSLSKWGASSKRKSKYDEQLQAAIKIVFLSAHFAPVCFNAGYSLNKTDFYAAVRRGFPA
jgi:hypothetical protein